MAVAVNDDVMAVANDDVMAVADADVMAVADDDVMAVADDDVHVMCLTLQRSQYRHSHHRQHHVSEFIIFISSPSKTFAIHGLHRLPLSSLPRLPSTPLLQMPVVPEYYMGSSPAHHMHGASRAHQAAGSTFALPQIAPKHYTGFSVVPSGFTSMAVSNKSTSHGHFLPSLYSEKPPVKVRSC